MVEGHHLGEGEKGDAEGAERFYKDSLAQHWARDWRALALTQVEKETCSRKA